MPLAAPAALQHAQTCFLQDIGTGQMYPTTQQRGRPMQNLPFLHAEPRQHVGDFSR